MSTQKSSVQLSNSVYDRIKPTVTVVLPALAGLYIFLANTWGLPHPEEVAGTIAAVNTFLGVLLHVSSKTYSDDGQYDGVAQLLNKDGQAYLGLVMNEGPESVANKDSVHLKVEDKT